MQRPENICGHYYVIRRGETLHEIAERCGITLDQLLLMNPYLNPAYHLVGQTIIVPEPSESSAQDKK